MILPYSNVPFSRHSQDFYRALQDKLCPVESSKELLETLKVMWERNLHRDTAEPFKGLLNRYKGKIDISKAIKV